MASSSGVWGIEIGQSALKALRCSIVDDEVVADAFDFIEYPKILSQPEAVPEELVADAINQLLDRNDGFNEKVVISVPGQTGLAKFFKPPPVELKKVADIVRYEARQQIPFDLADVVWDHQMMPGSLIEEGYALESEVGLFAMKRDQVYRQLQPFVEADIEVDQIQLAPLALYNMIAFDRLHERLANEAFDVDNPPDSLVLLSIGTDSSDLIITNGFRIWQRSMPIGGNHFTRQLTKDLKLTFAKAEHLKRNAREAVDPKLIFQTMRPVFNDLVTEVQRSIGFFRSIDKQANVTGMVVAGNTVKMPGLAAYLSKNLGFEVDTLDRFNRLTGDDVLSIPTFRDNAPTFAVCYGLCLQGLELSQVHASLVPQEILTERMIRAKKPWTLAALAALLLGMIGHYFLLEKNWEVTHPDLWDGAQSVVQQMSSYSNEHKTEDQKLEAKLTFLNALGKEVSGNSERRLVWLELMRVINGMIPREDFPNGVMPDPKERKPYEDRKALHITQVETKHLEDLSVWYTDAVKQRYKEELLSIRKNIGREVDLEELNALPGPTGPGWVIQLTGYHYYNSPKRMGHEGSNHVRNNLTVNFLDKTFKLPDEEGNMIEFTPQEYGLSYPILLRDDKPTQIQVPNPLYDQEEVFKAQTAIAERNFPEGKTLDDLEEIISRPPTLTVLRLDFDFQVLWQPTMLSDRIEAKRLAEEEAKAAEEAAAGTDDSVAMNAQ
ncbi:type IV pilus assembly protein PilM [Novipirellula caenicola]|uniref:Competence protein A n=1 Tax=Novipirellula caenicola TaxID=1536901 RepID=A0ABP9VZ43_9BACT